MRPHLIASLATALMAVACVSPTSLREKASYLDLQSARSAADVAVCITEGWENAGLFGLPLPIVSRTNPMGFTVFYQPQNLLGQTTVPNLADVSTTPGGYRTVYYKYPVVDEARFDSVVKSCQSVRPASTAVQ